MRESPIICLALTEKGHKFLARTVPIWEDALEQVGASLYTVDADRLRNDLNVLL